MTYPFNLNAAQEQRQLLIAYHYPFGVALGSWPTERSLFKSFGTQPKAAPVPIQQLHAISSAITEDKNMPAEGIALELVAR